MKKLKQIINHLITCVNCFGLGYVELGYVELGEKGTAKCTACKGKGFF